MRTRRISLESGDARVSAYNEMTEASVAYPNKYVKSP
ncbi:hypothetical protein PI124_g18783 [Phytophthora idaei]|nr:hypothetical protein PI125_g19654 [Phytophthora idaei]KAG3135747.1 hypothetical protein PI126_g18110 [Phytophthora idaei]KAG3236207.1 hypothetical protein PI124_g18783 [Phytophthora idaei]